MPAKRGRGKTYTRIATSASAGLHNNARDEIDGGNERTMLGDKHRKSSLEFDSYFLRKLTFKLQVKYYEFWRRTR